MSLLCTSIMKLILVDLFCLSYLTVSFIYLKMASNVIVTTLIVPNCRLGSENQISVQMSSNIEKQYKVPVMYLLWMTAKKKCRQ